MMARWARPRLRAAFAVLLAVLLAFVGGGTIFGFSSLQPVLEARGVFAGRCANHSTDSRTAPAQQLSQPPRLGRRPRPSGQSRCHAQELIFNLMYGVATALTGVFTLPAGVVCDNISPRVSALVGTAGLALGFAAFVLPGDWAAFAGLQLVAMAGPFLVVACLSTEALLPQHAAAVTAVVVTSFNSSSGVFLAAYWLWLGLGLSFAAIFGGLAAVTVLLGAGTAALLPTRQERRGEVAQPVGDEHQPLLPSAAAAAAVINTSELEHAPPSAGTSRRCSEPLPLRACLCSPLFVGLCLHLSLLSLCSNGYVGMIEDQLKWKGCDAHRSCGSMLDLFNWLFPVGCFLTGTLVMMPVASWADRRGRDAAHLALGALATVAVQALILFAPLKGQYAVFALFPLEFLWPWVAVPEVLRRHFPRAHYAKLVGICVFTQGVFGTLSYLLEYIALQLCGGSYLLVDSLLLGLAALTLLFPLSIQRGWIRPPSSASGSKSDMER